MLIHLHKQATTTPKVRAAIQVSDEPASTLAERFGTTEQGDALFAVLCGCGHNIRMILRHLRATFHQLIWLITRLNQVIAVAMAPAEPIHIVRMSA